MADYFYSLQFVITNRFENLGSFTNCNCYLCDIANENNQ